ncbi:MAG: hypothetical protein EHM84_00665 [Lysobacterales bacterium]|nr:MAG: hypothetical protein EHM84_00665 [Xanthomonadales bacterium]
MLDALQGRTHKEGNHARASAPRALLLGRRPVRPIASSKHSTACPKHRAYGFTPLSAIRTLIFLIAGKFDFRTINLHAHQST